jgi:hypothetical protein
MLNGSRSNVRHSALYLVLFLLLALVWTWPVASRLTSRIPHDPGDPVLNTWILWWNTQALPLSERWWSPPVFFPSTGMFALSEHLLGISLFTAPLQFAGLNAIGGYNVALILSYWLSGFFAFLLGRRLTGTTAGGLVAGVAYACAPYRAGQLSHLQVLSSQWMPLALFAMHAYLDDGKRRWLALFAAAWLLQALSNGYYLLFFPIFIVLWLGWFVRWRNDARPGLAIGGTFAAASLLLMPFLLRYRGVHESLGLTRTRGEMVLFSAHPDSLWKMPDLLRLWAESVGRTQEDFLFPGITALVILLSAGIYALRSTGLRAAIRRRSPLLFYAVCTLLMWWLSFGPAPEGAPMQALVRPYTWLTVLPGFSGLRAPSRFAMLACLSLSVAAALGVSRMRSRRRPLTALLAVVALAGLCLDGWTDPIPLRAPPGRFLLPDVRDAVVVELPVDDSFVNTAAMYRAMLHGRPTLNGYSGHTPPHFRILESAVRREDPSSLLFFARGRPLIIVVNGQSDENGDMLRFVRALEGVEEHGSSTAGSIFVLRARPKGQTAPAGARLPIAAVTRQPREHVVLDLGHSDIIRTVAFPVRWHYDEMGSRLAVEASDDGTTWKTVWEDWTAAPALAGALENQKDVPFRITLPDVQARYLRVHPAPPWLERELSVFR